MAVNWDDMTIEEIALIGPVYQVFENNVEIVTLRIMELDVCC